MKIIYFNFGMSDTHYKIIEENILLRPQKNPQRIFDRVVYEGIKSNGVDVLSLSLPPVPAYPKSKKIFINLNKLRQFNDEKNVNYIPVVNIPIIKQLCVFVYALIVINIQKNNKDLKILINWPYLPFVSAAILMKKILKIDIIQIIPDFPSDYFSYKKNKNIIEKIYSLSSRITMGIIGKFDAFVFLTKYMKEIITVDNSKYCIVEGMINPNTNFSESVYSKKNIDKKIRFMYAGSLNKKVGILDFIEAFKIAAGDNHNIELYIYGTGDSEESIKNIVSNSNNINFGGLLSRSEVLKKQTEVSFLVNPRPVKEEYTKYSFPSKTLENMLSGTPLITTRLSGIPNDYNDYLIYFENDSIEGMVNTLKRAIEMKNDYRVTFGKKSREWVKVNKNPKKQTQKIIEMLKKI
ncbi:glycosyltransferase [Exiguobacterium sp. USCH10]|uniref:glycosyltransferase n=1 Tax=Exiguobacterium sp. USCH10 TaxID=3024839 RepID=UPI0030990D6B